MLQGDVPIPRGIARIIGHHRGGTRKAEVTAMLVFTLDKEGKPGHPTRRADLVSKLVTRRKARIWGGGRSGKPPVVQFLDRTFDPSETVERRFLVFLDPGFAHVGFAVCEVNGDKIVVLLYGVLLCRTPLIRALMDERRMSRRHRRYCRRARMKRRSKRYSRWMVKFRPPRLARGRRHLSATIRHALLTHRNLARKLLKLVPLPAAQVVIAYEDAEFDLRRIVWGPTEGAGYQESPVGKRKGERLRDYVLRRDGGKCIVCGSTDDLNVHHLHPRKKQGTDRAENMVTLCSSCHKDVHAGLITLPVKGGPTWRAAATVNAVCSLLRDLEPGWTPVPVRDVVRKRRLLAFPKEHACDAIAGAAALVGALEVKLQYSSETVMIQYRRHNRAVVHATRDRLYYLGGELVARNRCKKMGQEQDSLSEFRAVHPEDVARLRVRPSVRIRAPVRSNTPAFPGEVWEYRGMPFVVDGVQHMGKSLHSEMLPDIVGKSYVPVRLCRPVRKNEGMVVLPLLTGKGGKCGAPPHG